MRYEKNWDKSNKKNPNIVNWKTQLQFYKIKLFSLKFNDTNDKIMDIYQYKKGS